MIVQPLGLVPYRTALALQEARRKAVAAGAEETIFLCEHPPVITLGRQAQAASMRTPAAALAARGVEVVPVSRGGDATCHFPGQLVAYVILRLAKRPGGLHGLVHALEETVIRLLQSRGVCAGRMAGRPGVWVEDRKIASIGLALRQWTTWHGLALNVGPDLSLFESIVPCGLAGVTMTSLCRELDGTAQPGAPVTVADLLDDYARILHHALAPAALAQGDPAR